jgi:hypothetical protein
MKRLVLCEVTIHEREYMTESKTYKALKQVRVGDGQTAEGVVEEHYRKRSDPYGTSYSVHVEEVEVIG